MKPPVRQINSRCSHTLNLTNTFHILWFAHGKTKRQRGSQTRSRPTGTTIRGEASILASHWHRVGIMLASRCACSTTRADAPTYTHGLHNTAVVYCLCLTVWGPFSFTNNSSRTRIFTYGNVNIQELSPPNVPYRKKKGWNGKSSKWHSPEEKKQQEQEKKG